MEGSGCKSLLVDVAEFSHRSTVAYSQQVKIVRMLAVLGEQRDRVNAGAVMMQLAFESAVFPAIEKVPIPSRAAVIAPTGNRRIVSENRIESYFRFFTIAEVVGPGIDLFLPRRIPRHLAAEWIRFLVPVIRAGAHYGFERSSLRRHALTLEVLQYRDEDIAFHLPELGVVPRVLHHRQSR